MDKQYVVSFNIDYYITCESESQAKKWFIEYLFRKSRMNSDDWWNRVLRISKTNEGR